MWKNTFSVGLLLVLASITASLNTRLKAEPLQQSQDDRGATTAAKPAQFVRIELPGANRILTLAEVEVFSSDKNVATTGKATQSSTDYDAGASRAIDGNKHRDWSKDGQTHTSNAGSRGPWWELDLQKPTQIESIKIWNRAGFESRLSNCTITLLDAKRKVVFQATKVAAGECVNVDAKSGKITYLTYEEKPGTPKANEARNRSVQAEPSSNEPPLVDVPNDYRDPTPFAFKKGDVVALVGNGLPDRMQHDGWLETVLQSSLKDHQLTFRNLSASGDRPDSFPRSKGAASITEYLRHVKADVVFAFFGYNESFAGVEQAGDYQRKLVDFVKRTRGSQLTVNRFRGSFSLVPSHTKTRTTSTCPMAKPITFS